MWRNKQKLKYNIEKVDPMIQKKQRKYPRSHREIGYPKDILWLPSSGHVDAPKRAAKGYPVG
jgi:hypothetical protein